MANPYDFNPFDPGADATYQQPKQPATPAGTGLGYAPTVTNPYAPPGSQWANWSRPLNELDRYAYTQQPRVAYQQFQNAWGAPNGNLQKFIDSQFGQLWADYIKQTDQANGNNLDLQWTDTLTKQAGDQLQQQWQSQTPYQRGENYASMGAGRRV